MGNSNSVIASSNDYELVIRTSKQLEHLLESQLGAVGKGLHEKADSIEHILTPQTVRKIHFLATIRNKLVHEVDFNQIPDRPKFIRSYIETEQQLTQLLRQMGKTPPNKKHICVIQ